MVSILAVTTLFASKDEFLATYSSFSNANASGLGVFVEGAGEAALFDKLISIIIEQRDGYDHLVFDTAPTWQTIRLLSLPRSRREHEQQYIKLIGDTFENQKLVYVPLFSGDITNKRQLEKISEYLTKG